MNIIIYNHTFKRYFPKVLYIVALNLFKCLRINTNKHHANYFKKFKCLFFFLSEAFKATIYFDEKPSEYLWMKNENIFFIFMNIFNIIEILNGKAYAGKNIWRPTLKLMALQILLANLSLQLLSAPLRQKSDFFL